jgi:Schlafen, AlbA_2
MSSLEHLIRYESAHSGLAFRRDVYAPGDEAAAIIDCLALANAEIGNRSRYLCLGVDDRADGAGRLVGVRRDEIRAFKRRFDRLIADAIEPGLAASVHAVEIDGRSIGVIRLKHCTARPYLARTAMGKALAAGVGYIRRGAKNHPLQRADMQRMFGAGEDRAAAKAAVRVGFHGAEPLERLALPALPVNRLPSDVAADALRSMLAAKEQSRSLFGRTETRLSRLVHAKFFGMDAPFARQSDDSLLQALESVDADYRVADEHYLYEIRAHKLNLLVVNDSATNLTEARLRVTIPRLKRVGIAEKIFTESDLELALDGYPKLSVDARQITLEADLGTLYARRGIRAFREPARFWAREEAAGKSIPFRYELIASELAEPVAGTLVLAIEAAALKSV